MDFNTQKIAAALLEKSLAVADTETTGLCEHSEIIEFAAISETGETLVDTLLMPTRPVPKEATKINGITDSQVINEGIDWCGLASQIETLRGRVIVYYNAVFDVRLLGQTQSFQEFGCTADFPDLDFMTLASFDLMELANRHFHKDLNWKKSDSCFSRLSLKKCCELAGIEYPEDSHRALADAQTTLKLLQFIARDTER